MFQLIMYTAVLSNAPFVNLAVSDETVREETSQKPTGLATLFARAVGLL